MKRRAFQLQDRIRRLVRRYSVSEAVERHTIINHILIAELELDAEHGVRVYTLDELPQ